MSLLDAPLAPPPGRFAQLAAFQADPRAHKRNLRVGIVVDDDGRTHPLDVVRAAEVRLAERGASDPDDLPPAGDPRFREAVATHVLDRPGLAGSMLHTPGGTGALRLAAGLVRRLTPDATWWVTEPTWPNHARVAAHAGLEVARLPWRPRAAPRPDRAPTLDLDAVLETLDARARPGDVVVLHAACHNPTGLDPSARAWATLGDALAAQELVPLIDAAFLGFAEPLPEELRGAWALCDRVPLALWTTSLAKTLRMYDDRPGALVLVADEARAAALHSQAVVVARALWSTPPARAARVATEVLASPDLRAGWQDHLHHTRGRIRALRAAWDAALTERGRPDLATARHVRGLFTFLPLRPGGAQALQQDGAWYVGPTGGLNLTALGARRLAPFLDDALPWLLGP